MDQQQGMKLNVHLAVPVTTQEAGSHTHATGGHTPNTPEILNSIVNMQLMGGPFAAYSTASAASTTSGPSSTVTTSNVPTLVVTSPTEEVNSPTSDSMQSLESLNSPSSGLSVQQYRSQFIKEGLKMKVQQKLGSAPSPYPAPRMRTPSSASDDSHTKEFKREVKEEDLTEEDAVRRLRRRERNKVAATKCRNKKKLRTQLLIKESETLESQNQSLKNEVVKLEMEKKRLMDILSGHEPACVKRIKTEEEEFRVPAMTTAMSTPMTVPMTTPMAAPMAMAAAPMATPPGLPELQQRYPEYPEQSEYDAQIFSSYYEDNSQAGASSSTSMHHFLAKRSLGHAYTNLDSRCLAL